MSLSPGEDQHAGLAGGWLLPDPGVREALCTRSILCRSFRRADGLLDIDGRFMDTRAFDYDSEFRGPCAAGSALHHMQLRLTLDRNRQIVALVSAMPATPYETCPAVNPNFQRLVGLSLERGFRRALRERLGGVAGCTHVTALLDAMAAAAVQSFASNAYAPRETGAGGSSGQADPVRLWPLESLIDSCHSYRSDGPVVARMKQR